MKQVATMVTRIGRKGSYRLIYARHFYYVDFRKFGVHRFAYITILRHPVSRLISSYLYYHFSSKTHIQVFVISLQGFLRGQFAPPLNFRITAPLEF